MVAPRGAATVIGLDTPAGLVKATAAWTGTKVECVDIEMPVSFVEHLDHPLEVPGLGSITVDVAFGRLLFRVDRCRGTRLRDRAGRGARSGRRRHADSRGGGGADPGAPSRSAELRPHRVSDLHGGRRRRDSQRQHHPPRSGGRSPCGTGTAARLALMYERGQLGVGEEVSARSIVGGPVSRPYLGRSDGMSVDRTAVRTSVSGRAWIHGRHTARRASRATPSRSAARSPTPGVPVRAAR